MGAPLYVLHNAQHNWKHPSEFKPERWHHVPTETFVSGINQEKSSESITFMPFSSGPRNCVGQSLARVEVLTLLAKLLGNFEFRLASEVKQDPNTTDGL